MATHKYHSQLTTTELMHDLVARLDHLLHSPDPGRSMARPVPGHRSPPVLEQSQSQSPPTEWHEQQSLLELHRIHAQVGSLIAALEKSEPGAGAEDRPRFKRISISDRTCRHSFR